jgi:multidrug efflux pump subunit AcrB
MSNMKSSFFPLNEPRVINVNINYPGASPAEIEEGIVLKIEDNLRGLEGIDRVTSSSKENLATITIETLKGYEVDVILADVKNAIDRVPSYPTEMEPIIVAKKVSSRQTIVFTLSGGKVPLSSLKIIARQIEADMRMLDGISQVKLSGFPLQEIVIALRENDLRAYNISFASVAKAVSEANIISTGGSIKTKEEDFLIRANHRSYYAKDIDNIVLRATTTGDVIRLKDVAEVSDAWNESPDRIYFNDDLAIEFSISNTNSEDLISSAQKVRGYITEFNQKNQNIQLNISSDSSTTLTERTDLLINNGTIGLALVLIFLALFLNFRLGFWVAAGLPIAFLGMYVFVGMFGVTINVLSLFGMIIVIGMLVDDGIVIAENIYNHYEKGKSPIDAAIDGTMEVLTPILSAILTTIVAFSTFFFLDGRVGEFFSEVSVVVTITLLISLVEALIILPSHIAHSKALRRDEKPNKFAILTNKLMYFMRDKTYAPVLRFSLKHKFFSFSVLTCLFLLTIGSIGGGIIKTTFFPSIASNKINIVLDMPEGTNEIITDSLITMIEEKAWLSGEELTKKYESKKPLIQNIIKKIGSGTNKATLIVNLLPGEQREISSDIISNAIRDRVGEIYGVENLIFGSGTSFGGKPVSVSLISSNEVELKAAKFALKAELRKNSMLRDITDNDPQGIKEIQITLKEKAYLLGLTTNSVMRQIRSGFFGLQAQRIQRGQDEVKIWIKYRKENRSSLADLDKMYIPTPSGEQVPFSEIASYEIRRGDVAINHVDGQKEVKVEASLSDPKESATSVLSDIRAAIMPKIMQDYPSVTAIYEGQNREASKVQGSAKKTLPFILFMIFAIIAFSFRSFSQPVMLLAMVPFSLIGVAWGHFFHGFAINILSWLGIIALIGIMVNDGLVLISKFNQFLKEGMTFDEALLEAGRSRFRAIFLTSVTTIAGLAPLIFEKSLQAQFLIPMAISIAYGIGIATVLTLILLPIFLSFGNSLKRYSYWLFNGRLPAKREVERAVKEIEELSP